MILYCLLKSRPVVSPGARKPSAGEGIESSCPLICSFSPFVHTSHLLCFYTPLVVCISANNNNNNNNFLTSCGVMRMPREKKGREKREIQNVCARLFATVAKRGALDDYAIVWGPAE